MKSLIKALRMSVKNKHERYKRSFVETYKGLKQRAIGWTANARSGVLLSLARAWQFAYRMRNWISMLRIRHGGKLRLFIVIVLLAGSALITPILQERVQFYFAVPDRLEGFKTLLLTLGGALIGATAIAFSLIMFAMQVNVERMPHGLFRKFSSDAQLLGAFATTFFLAFSITCLSLIPDESWVAVAAVTSVWSSALIIGFFLLAYKRALNLISPTKQLALIVADAKRHFEKWDRAANRTVPLIRANSKASAAEAGVRSRYDIDRVTYFQLHPSWTSAAEQAIAYCITFSRRYVEQGDYEVSRAALHAIVAINALYVKTKGKTFFSNNYLMDNPLASDTFLTSTLEHLRQNVQVGIQKKDEQQIEQNFLAMAQLTQVYLGIEYGDERAIHSHGHLAAGYLSSAVKSVASHDMADVLIEGVMLLGKVAHLILQQKEPEYITSISNNIAFIGCLGAVNQHYRPVTQVAVSQLATLTFELIRGDIRNVAFAMGEVKGDVKMIAEMYLKTPDTPLSSIHSASLAAYYSGTSENTLTAWLTGLAKAVSDASADDPNARRVVHHMAQWADELYQTEKDLFLLAIEKKSHFTFDLMHWIVHITKLLLAVSNAGACDDRNREELRRGAIWLISTLSWVPASEEAVRFVENFRMTENLFEAAIDAKRRGCDDVALKIRELFVGWTFKAGKYQRGWAVLEQAACGLVCLNIILELQDSVILEAVREWVAGDDAPGLDLRFRAAEAVREEADKYHEGELEFRAIQSAMASIEQVRLRNLLHQIADALVPEVTRKEDSREEVHGPEE